MLYRRPAAARDNWVHRDYSRSRIEGMREAQQLTRIARGAWCLPLPRRMNRPPPLGWTPSRLSENVQRPETSARITRQIVERDEAGLDRPLQCCASHRPGAACCVPRWSTPSLLLCHKVEELVDRVGDRFGSLAPLVGEGVPERMQ